jgi:hypothetical protein
MAEREPIPVMRIRGRQEMRDLALGAFNALAEANLIEEMEALNARVFGRGAEAICETAVLSDHLWQWNFAPMVELVLHEIREVAANDSLTRAQRRERIEWALTMAGF